MSVFEVFNRCNEVVSPIKKRVLAYSTLEMEPYNLANESAFCTAFRFEFG